MLCCKATYLKSTAKMEMAVYSMSPPLKHVTHLKGGIHSMSVHASVSCASVCLCVFEACLHAPVTLNLSHQNSDLLKIL